MGINNIGYYSDEFSPVDAWKGTLKGSAFELIVYKSRNTLFGNYPSTTYIVGESFMGKPIAALAFHSPVWWIRFTANTIVWAAKYQIQGQQQAPLRYYAVDLANGKITTVDFLLRANAEDSFLPSGTL